MIWYVFYSYELRRLSIYVVACELNVVRVDCVDCVGERGPWPTEGGERAERSCRNR